ncbi:MAG: citrate lyase holo-[acyl-carrier protein] synthase, partial [Oscillospiraceae bacterium]
MHENEELLRVLDAREVRWRKRLQMSQEWKKTLVAITLCLPLICRTHKDYVGIFTKLCERVRDCFAKAGIAVDDSIYIDGADGPACLFTAEGDAFDAKRLCVMAEENILGGRMLDIDVMDKNGAPIGRTMLSLPPRRCFICEQPAAACVSRKLHQPKDIVDCTQRLL